MARKMIKGWTNTPKGRVHWEKEKGVVDFGFNVYVFTKKQIVLMKKLLLK